MKVPDGRMRLRVVVHEFARAHGAEHGEAAPARVLTPADTLAHTWVFSPYFDNYGMLWSNRADLLRLGALFRLAAVSPHSLVHVPVPDTEPDGPVARRQRMQAPVSLVIARDSVGLRPSQWTQIRRQLGRGAPRSMRAPAPQPVGDRLSYERSAPLRLTEHAATLVVAGPAAKLFEAGDRLTESGHCVATSRQVHKHGEATMTTFTDLIADTERGSGNPRERRFEWDVYVSEPIFHKARWQAVRRAANAANAAGADQPSRSSKPRASRPPPSRSRW